MSACKLLCTFAKPPFYFPEALMFPPAQAGTSVRNMQHCDRHNTCTHSLNLHITVNKKLWHKPTYSLQNPNLCGRGNIDSSEQQTGFDHRRDRGLSDIIVTRYYRDGLVCRITMYGHLICLETLRRVSDKRIGTISKPGHVLRFPWNEDRFPDDFVLFGIDSKCLVQQQRKHIG